MAALEVKVPDIGDFKDVEIIEVLVKPGDRIEADQSLITVESDKASMEIPSSAAGVVREMKVKVGDKVSEGSLVLVLDAEGGAPAGDATRSASAAAACAAAPAAGCAGASRSGAARAGGGWRRRGRGRRPRHRRLRRGRGDRGARQAGRYRRPRAEPRHRRERQGVDGDPVERGRRRQGPARQGRRQGLARDRPRGAAEDGRGRAAELGGDAGRGDQAGRGPHRFGAVGRRDASSCAPRRARPSGICRPPRCPRTSRPRRQAPCRMRRRRSGSSPASSAFRSTR